MNSIPLHKPESAASFFELERVEALARKLGSTRTLALHLLRMGQQGGAETERFLTPRLRDLTPPDAMLDRTVAAQRLARAVREKEPICVFGDYDCDGITATAILTEALRSVGATVTPLLASRFDGGYGVSAAAVRHILAARPRLLVTCDCGSSDHETLAEIAAAGVEVIVIDHHLVPARPLPAVAFLNPHRPECGFPYKGLASCGLALSMAAALRRELGVELDVRRWLDLVAIGSIADVAPLDGDNRALVAAGLKALREGARPGLRALMALAKVDASSPLTAQDVAFRIAPRLNAPGRMGAPDLALQLLLAQDATEAEVLAERVEQQCQARREVQDAILREAREQIAAGGWDESPGLVLGRPGWNHGIVGIVAGRLADELRRPVIVVGFEGETGRGSVRGPQGARLFDAVQRVSEVLERFGGHQAAAGLEVRLERLDELRVRFAESCTQLAFDDAKGELPPLELAEGEDPSDVLRDLYRLEPCGMANPAPRLELRGEVLSAREVRGGHLKLELGLPGGRRLGGFGANLGAMAGRLMGRAVIRGTLRPDRWRGGDAVEVMIDEVELDTERHE